MSIALRCVAAAAVVLMGTACSQLPGIGGSAASPAVSASPTGQLDAQVSMPPGFPSDVPIYANARLTAKASFASTGQAAWGMEWETLDAATNVQAFYVKQFAQGDWTLSVSHSAPGAFAGTVSRKSNSHVTGVLSINRDGGVTKILLSLVIPT